MCWVVGGIKLLWIMKNVCSAVTRCRSFPELWHIAKGLLVYHGISQPAIDWWKALQKYSRGGYVEGAFSDDVRMCNQLEPRGFSLGMQRSIEWYGGSGNTEGAYNLCMKRLTWRGGRWSFPSFRIICSSKFQVWATKVIDTRPSNWLQLEGREGKRFNKNWKSKGTLNGLWPKKTTGQMSFPVTPWSNLIRNVCYRR